MQLRQLLLVVRAAHQTKYTHCITAQAVNEDGKFQISERFRSGQEYAFSLWDVEGEEEQKVWLQLERRVNQEEQWQRQGERQIVVRTDQVCNFEHRREQTLLQLTFKIGSLLQSLGNIDFSRQPTPLRPVESVSSSQIMPTPLTHSYLPKSRPLQQPIFDKQATLNKRPVPISPTKNIDTAIEGLRGIQPPPTRIIYLDKQPSRKDRLVLSRHIYLQQSSEEISQRAKALEGHLNQIKVQREQSRRWKTETSDSSYIFNIPPRMGVPSQLSNRLKQRRDEYLHRKMPKLEPSTHPYSFVENQATFRPQVTLSRRDSITSSTGSAGGKIKRQGYVRQIGNASAPRPRKSILDHQYYFLPNRMTSSVVQTQEPPSPTRKFKKEQQGKEQLLRQEFIVPPVGREIIQQTVKQKKRRIQSLPTLTIQPTAAVPVKPYLPKTDKVRQILSGIVEQRKKKVQRKKTRSVAGR